MTHELTRWIYSAAELESRLQDAGGELTPALEEWLQAMEIRMPKSVDNAKLLLDRLETLNTEWAERAKAVAKMAQGLTKARERVKESLKAAMVANGVTELTGDQYRLALSPSRPSLILDESLLPVAYKTQTIEYVPDKAEIRAALENDVAVPGARLEPSYSLRSYFAKKTSTDKNK